MNPTHFPLRSGVPSASGVCFHVLWRVESVSTQVLMKHGRTKAIKFLASVALSFLWLPHSFDIGLSKWILLNVSWSYINAAKLIKIIHWLHVMDQNENFWVPTKIWNLTFVVYPFLKYSLPITFDYDRKNYTFSNMLSKNTFYLPFRHISSKSQRLYSQVSFANTVFVLSFSIA